MADIGGEFLDDDEHFEDATMQFGGSVGRCISFFNNNREEARLVKIYSKSKRQWYQNSLDNRLSFSIVPPRHRKSTVVKAKKSMALNVDLSLYDSPSQHRIPENTNMIILDDGGCVKIFSYSKLVQAGWNSAEADEVINEGVVGGQKCFIRLQNPSTSNAFSHTKSWVALADCESPSIERLPLRFWRHTTEMLSHNEVCDRISLFPVRDYVGRLGPYIFCGEPTCEDDQTYQAIYVEVSDISIVYFSKEKKGAFMTKSAFLCNEHDRVFYQAFGRFPVEASDFENTYAFSVQSDKLEIEPESSSFNLTTRNVWGIIEKRGGHPANEFWLRVFKTLLSLHPDEYFVQTPKEARNIYTRILNKMHHRDSYGFGKKQQESMQNIILMRGSDPVNEYFKELWICMYKSRSLQTLISRYSDETVPIKELVAMSVVRFEILQNQTSLNESFEIPKDVKLRAQEGANIWRAEYIQHRYSFDHLVDSLEGILDYRPLVYSGRCSLTVADIEAQCNVHKSSVVVTNAIFDYHYVLIIIIGKNLFTLNLLEVADKDFQEVYRTDPFWKDLIQWSRSNKITVLDVGKQTLPKHIVRTDYLIAFVENLVEYEFDIAMAEKDFDINRDLIH